MDKKLNSIHVSSSGNLVSVIMDRSKRLLSIEVDDSLLDKSQKELLEEFIASTVNEAVHKVDEMNKDFVAEDDNIKESMPHSNMFDMSRVSKIAEDLSKLTSIGKDENGKPMLNIPLDTINPAMIKNMFDMMNKDNNDKDKK